MNLELQQQQVDLLREVLDASWRDLRYEVANTDNSIYKRELREREDTMRSLLDMVGGPLPDR